MCCNAAERVYADMFWLVRNVYDNTEIFDKNNSIP